MTQELQFLSEEIKNTTALNILFPISLVLGSARRRAHEISRKKMGCHCCFWKFTSSHPLASFIFGILSWDKMDSFMWFCLETCSVWQLLAAQGTYFWGKIHSLFPVSDCFSLLLSVSSPRRKQVIFEDFFFFLFFLSPSRFYWCWLGAVVGASMCWACFTPNLPNEGGVSALEPPFHYDGFEFHCVVCFLLVQVQTAASCTESLLLPVVHLL